MAGGACERSPTPFLRIVSLSFAIIIGAAATASDGNE